MKNKNKYDLTKLQIEHYFKIKSFQPFSTNKFIKISYKNETLYEAQYYGECSEDVLIQWLESENKNDKQ